MKLSSLLAQRQALQQQTRLANLAFAYDRLSDFVRRIRHARLTGEVCLRQAVHDADHYWASLTALQGSQAVLEEHFSDEDVMDFADVIAFVIGEEEVELTFRLEETRERFLAPLRARLQRAGVTLDRMESAASDLPSHDSPECPQGRDNDHD